LPGTPEVAGTKKKRKSVAAGDSAAKKANAEASEPTTVDKTCETCKHIWKAGTITKGAFRTYKSKCAQERVTKGDELGVGRCQRMQKAKDKEGGGGKKKRKAAVDDSN
jgi:hypothetical protein